MNYADATNYPDATDFGKEIIPSSISNHKVISYQYDGYWTDIGNIYSFFEANLALTDQMYPAFNLFNNAKPVFTRARMLPPAKISGTTLRKNNDCRRLHYFSEPHRNHGYWHTFAAGLGMVQPLLILI